MAALAWIFGIVGAIVAIAIIVVFLNRFYRKSTRDVALVRTGFGGQRIVISGGCLALPFLHKVDEINMRTIRVEVKRTGEKSLITTDRIRVDVELEFYVRIHPTAEGIATAAQAIATVPNWVRCSLRSCKMRASTGNAVTLMAAPTNSANSVNPTRSSESSG